MFVKILSEHQFAFRKELGTELQPVGVVEKIKGGFQRKYMTGAVLLDVDEYGRMASYTSRSGLTYHVA